MISTSVTESFPFNIGTRQSDRTSSTISTLFINELSSLSGEKCGTCIFITNDIPDILCLMYADDVANCDETATKLQQQLNVVDQFCLNTGMKIILDITQISVFRNGGRLRKYESWSFRSQHVNTTAVYKNIGVL